MIDEREIDQLKQSIATAISDEDCRQNSRRSLRDQGPISPRDAAAIALGLILDRFDLREKGEPEERALALGVSIPQPVLPTLLPQLVALLPAETPCARCNHRKDQHSSSGCRARLDAPQMDNVCGCSEFTVSSRTDELGLRQQLEALQIQSLIGDLEGAIVQLQKRLAAIGAVTR